MPDTQTVRQRQVQLDEFVERFGRLAGLLNEASHYGPTGRHEIAYSELRAWMLRHYGSMRKHLTPYLGDGRPRGFAEARGDDFEVLFGAPTLHELLRCDDGRLPAVVRRASEALATYRTHLLALATTV